MTIEFTNATPTKNNSGLSATLLVLSCLFFFVPITLIVLGYYTSLPTGTLVSPIPQGIISNNSSDNLPSNESSKIRPIIAAPEVGVASKSAETSSNATQKTITLIANQQEATITDPEILETSQIYLVNKTEDKSLYTIKSKSAGSFTISANSISNTDRTIDYQIVNP